MRVLSVAFFTVTVRPSSCCVGLGKGWQTLIPKGPQPVVFGSLLPIDKPPETLGLVWVKISEIWKTIEFPFLLPLFGCRASWWLRSRSPDPSSGTFLWLNSGTGNCPCLEGHETKAPGTASIPVHHDLCFCLWIVIFGNFLCSWFPGESFLLHRTNWL